MTEHILEHFSLDPVKMHGLIKAAEQYESDLYDKLKLGDNTYTLSVKQQKLKEYLKKYKNDGYNPADYLLEDKIDQDKVYELFKDKDMHRYKYTSTVTIDDNTRIEMPNSVYKLLRMSEDPKYNIGNINEILDIVSIDDLAESITQQLKGYVKITTNDGFYKSFEDTLTHDIELEIYPEKDEAFSLYIETKANLDNFHMADIEKTINSDFYSGLKETLRNITLQPKIEEQRISSTSWGDIYDIIITYTIPSTIYQNIAEEILKQKIKRTPIFSTYGKSDKIKLSSEILNDFVNNNMTSIYIELSTIGESYNSDFDEERKEAYRDIEEYTNIGEKALYDSFQKASLWYGTRT